MPLLPFCDDLEACGACFAQLSPPGADQCGLREAVDRLALAGEKLPVLAAEGGGHELVDTKSPDGIRACRKFLALLEEVSSRFGVAASDRSYRRDFARNYRWLFPDLQRRYRVDILEAALERFDSFRLNGEEFKLCLSVLLAGDALARAWCELGTVLKRPGHTESNRLRELLGRFDAAWAHFERRYIRELMLIEDSARYMILDLVALDRELVEAESSSSVSPAAVAEARAKFADQVGHVNSIANTSRKGRMDMAADVVETAHDLLTRGLPCTDAGKVVALALVRAFDSLREYFRNIVSSYYYVDPLLGNNPVLVERLSVYEDAWEVAAHYLSDAPRLAALQRATSKLCAVRCAEPRFDALCGDCDAELFLVLPRLLLLFFLREPQGQAPLLSGLLPECFAASEGTAAPRPGDDLQAFVDDFVALARALSGCAGACPALPLISDDGGVAEACLIAQGLLGAADPEHRQLVVADVGLAERLRRFGCDLEAWSMKLQRFCPNDWNRCAAVLIRCLGVSVSDVEAL